MNMNLASIHLVDATRLASRAAGKEAAIPDFKCWEADDLIKAIAAAADALGYRIEKIQAAEQKEAA